MTIAVSSDIRLARWPVAAAACLRGDGRCSAPGHLITAAAPRRKYHTQSLQDNAACVRAADNVNFSTSTEPAYFPWREQ